MSDPFDRELALIVDDMLSPKARSRALAAFAREEIAVTKAANEAAIRRVTRKPRVTVDGRRDAALGTVKPAGTIVAEFDFETNAVRWVLRQLEQVSPEKSGRYEASHTLFVDGVEHAGEGELPEGREYVLASDVVYAKKLDKWNGLPARSKQAPNGVYEAVAAIGAKRFAGNAEIFYTFRDVPGRDGKTYRQPAIVIKPMGGTS